MLKTASRTRSEVGRVSSPFGAAIEWPLREPAMILTAAWRLGALSGPPPLRELEPLGRVEARLALRRELDLEAIPRRRLELVAGQEREQHGGRNELRLVFHRCDERRNSVV